MDWLERLSAITGILRLSPLIDNREGPIKSMVYRKLGSGEFEATAFLNEKFLPKIEGQQFRLYDEFIGQGRSNVKSSAIVKAISEALERWAYFAVRFTSDPSIIGRYAIDINPTTSGFAAFPSPRKRPARSRAWLEAKERWDIANWWAGTLPSKATSIDHSTIEIQIASPLRGFTIIVQRKTASGFVYGFAAGIRPEMASIGALREMDRNVIILDRAKSNEFNPSTLHLFEQRLLYFASQQGGEMFAAS